MDGLGRPKLGAGSRGNRSSSFAASRRRVLTGVGASAVGLTALAGCLDGFGRAGSDLDSYGPGGAPVESTAVSWDELGDLEGELRIYSGRTRDQIEPLFKSLEEEYPGFTIHYDFDGHEEQLASIREEGEHTPADLYYTQESGDLAILKADGLVRELPEDVIDAVDETYSDPDGRWTGASGRVRAIQYNTNAFDAVDLPEDVFAYAEEGRFTGRISTRPNSGSFRAFIVAMIELEGESATREWVRAMVEEQDVRLYSGGSEQARAVADGEQDVALGNQYYAGRILSNEPDAPIDVTFTRNDAGCLFNVSGLAILEGADRPNLAAEFTRHVLAREGQEFFVETNGEYPVLDGVEYVGDLPTLDEIEPPQIDLNALGDRHEEADDLLRQEGMRL